MSEYQFKSHPSLLDEINMLVKGNEDLGALISDVLKKRRTLTNSLRPVGTGPSTEHPKQILMASSKESCNAVPPDELSMSPAIAIENITAKLSKVILYDVEGSPLSNSFNKSTKLRAYEDSADDEASSDDSRDSLSSWLTIDSSDEDSKYPSTLDDDYDDSSFDESNESGSVYEESLRTRSSGGGRDRNGNHESADEYDWKSKHYSSTGEFNSGIDALKSENKNNSGEFDGKSSGSSKTVDSCNKETKDCSSGELNSEIEVIEGENNSVRYDDSRESVEKSKGSSKTVESCNKETKDCSSDESDSETEAIESETKSASLDDSSESDDTSSDSSKTVDSCNEETKDCSSEESDSEIEAIEGEIKYVSPDDLSESDDKSSDSSKTVDSCNEETNACSSEESDSEIEDTEGETKSVSSDDSRESDEKSSDSSNTVDSCNEETNACSSEESNSEIEDIEDENKSASSDDSSESDNRSSDSSKTVDSCDEELNHYSSLTESESEIECEVKSDSSSSYEFFHLHIAMPDRDSTDSSTSKSSESSDFSEAKISDENNSESQQLNSFESGDKVWIEPRGRLSSDWGDSSPIESDDSMVCMKAGKDKIIITKRNKTGEIQDICFFPDFPKWRESSTSKNESLDESTKESDSKALPQALLSSEESEKPFPDAAENSKLLLKKDHRQPKRRKHRMVDQLKDRISTSSYANFLERVLTGEMYDPKSTSSSDESVDNIEMSPSYKKYSRISEDLSPSNEFNNEQSGPQSHKSNTYRKFKDVDERM